MPAAVERRVDAAYGVRLHVEENGCGEPMLLVTGLGYATWTWRKQLPAFAERMRVIAFDNRGAGRSDKPDAPYSIDLLADDAVAVLRALNALPAHVVGFSMGGYVALTLAARHPEAVRSLVLSGTSGGGPGALGVPARTAAAWQDAAGLSPAEFARDTMALAFAPGWTERYPEDFEEILSARLEHPTPGYSWRRQFRACEEFLATGVTGDLPDVPALVLHGTRDRIVPCENAAPLAARFPRGGLALLRGAGHLACLERPHAYNQLVLDFVGQVQTGRN